MAHSTTASMKQLTSYPAPTRCNFHVRCARQSEVSDLTNAEFLKPNSTKREFNLSLTRILGITLKKTKSNGSLKFSRHPLGWISRKMPSRRCDGRQLDSDHQSDH